MQSFTELKVWQRSHLLALRVYVLTQAFPEDERYGLTSQLRRAVTSIPINIAEGSKRLWSNDYSRFLTIAQGSAAQVEGLLFLGRDLGFMSVETAAPLLEEADHVSRMLEALRQRIDRGGLPPSTPAPRARSTPLAHRSAGGRPHAAGADGIHADESIERVA